MSSGCRDNAVRKLDCATLEPKRLNKAHRKEFQRITDVVMRSAFHFMACNDQKLENIHKRSCVMVLLYVIAL